MTHGVILVVEDDAKNMKLARDVLRRQGYEVLEAMCAGDGVDLARDRRPDLILMDINLPDFDGRTALAKIREDPMLDATPVAAFTASAMAGSRESLLREGFAAYISKPIRLQAFLDDVARLCVDRTVGDGR